ncbi:SpoIIIAH-like family protein [Filobacillus milosensis]|uniref:SpoIIIAH-like family protein n=1 Tax=Filobacillus milosensis TaxID=94137 RepID=A0A4Y8IUF2_9BACI|nr:SpoIIIAH-like family protein [Filobacillus milosensis]TFB23839.1 SpoIIIAH-like family protein [Filobacillus milosensis]
MVLKKQTVWLITMLSLLIVLSVYYMTAPGDDVAVVDPDGEEKNGEEESGTENETESDMDELDVSGMTVDELFATTRMEKQDTRSMLIEEWHNVVSSPTATTEEKSEAMDQIHELRTIAQKETILENTIQHEKNYRDVLVQKDEAVVSITVIAEELSKTDANQLMQMARDEFGVMEVQVRLQQDDV